MSQAVRRFALTLSMFAVSAIFCGPVAGQQTSAPEIVVGRDYCKICHQSEFDAWEHSSHNLNAWKLLDHPKAAGFAKALGVTNLKGNSACTQCHGTQIKRGDEFIINQGNSCESCHGGAGGKDGWFRHHFQFGVGRKVDRNTKMADLMMDRLKETAEHRASRDAACKAAGLNRSADAFEIAQNCLNCHLVPNEKLVAAGHPISTRFEFVEWSQGEVRHNFLLDRSKNAESPTNWLDAHRNGEGRTVEARKRLMFVVGQLADLEVSLRCRSMASSTKRGTMGDEANDRILDVKDELEDLEFDDLKPVLVIVDDMDKSSLREITDGDQRLYTAAAAAVAKAAKAFAAAQKDGSKLPDSIDVPSKAKGEPHQG